MPAAWIVTIIADNYYGYCKKEVKTQISYSANLYGLAEEEHAGGAIVYPSYDLGEEFFGDVHVQPRGHSYEDMVERYPSLMDARPEGYAVDCEFPDILYVPEDVVFDLTAQTVTWETDDDGGTFTLPLQARRTYVRPSGYKQAHRAAAGAHVVAPDRHRCRGHAVPQALHGVRRWQVGDLEGHLDAILPGPVFVADFEADMDRVAGLIERDYSIRYRSTARTVRRTTGRSSARSARSGRSSSC